MRLAALLLCLATPLAAQQDAADAVEQLKAAGARLEAAAGGRDQIKALTETVRAYEAGLIAMRDGLRQITIREGEIAADLNDQREELARLVGVLSVISKTPQPVILAHPDGAQDAARAGMLTTDMAAGLQAEVDGLRAQLQEAQQLKAEREVAAQTLRDGLVGAQTARARLGQALSDRTTLPLRFDEDPVQTALLVASAQTLGDFAEELAANTPPPENTLSASGDLPLPVAGIVLPNHEPGRPGVTIGTAPRALVTTPVNATVLFQGPLLNYGSVVVLEPTVDVMFVLAGFAHVFVQPGEILSAGAPIGLLGGIDAGVDSILTSNGDTNTGQTHQALYLEVRDGQSAVSPDAWFALE
ncbi:MAG: hypothetical protein AAFP85_06165 [Pseudomonadota bacterium]